MKLTSKELIADLKKRTESILADAQEIYKKSTNELNAKASPEKWSALECLEHLNRYGDFYIPEINQCIKNANHETTSLFISGLLGDKFAKMMLPGAKPMNTFKSMNPSFSKLRENVLEKFIAQQEKMLEILNRCENYNLTKIKTSISISSLIKLRLGDTLRVVIYHNQRHVAQAQHAIAVYQSATEAA